MAIYVVKEGDSVDTIAMSQNVDVNTIIFDNQLVYPYELAVGQALFIGKRQEVSGLTISVGGNAYPFINGWVLEQTLPFLTEVSVFSYGFTKEGNLIPPIWDDQWMIDLALTRRVQSILTLTPLGPGGMFNNVLVNSVVNNTGYTENLIQLPFLKSVSTCIIREFDVYLFIS